VRGDSRQRHPIPPTRWPTRAEAEASRLYSPVVLGPLTLRARTWIPAMVPWRATDEGEVTPEVLEWYGRFAEGRPGAIVVEATGIRDVPSGPLLRIGHDRYIPGLARLADEVRRRSGGHTKLLIQLIDFLSIRRRPEPERYFGRFLAVGPEHHARLAEATGEAHWAHASEAELRAALAARPELWRAVLSARELEALEYGQRERVTDVHLSHVRELPAVLPGLFAAAAGRAAAAGFDGVELHYAHAYTMASFLSRTNDRADGYGGSLEGRLRLPLEVIASVAQALPASVALGCRFLGDEVIADGSREAEAKAYGVAFARAGLHFLSLSKGGKFEDAKQPKVGHAAYPYTGESGHECMPTVWSDARGPFGRNLHLAHAVRSAVRAAGLETPVIAAGGITTFELAEAALTGGACDVVASARQALADPDWLEKVRLGHGEAVRRCALTNYCEGLDQQHKQVTCRLWDRLDVPGAEGRTRSHDGKRWLVAPPWRAPEG
jgi:2,4-dienoyl-CoA reductase-like NADH-dependent reductase (Old Yellow Enzyme family)